MWLKGWSNRPYIKCLLKKDEVKPTEEATTNTSDDYDFMAELEEEAKQEKS